MKLNGINPYEAFLALSIPSNASSTQNTIQIAPVSTPPVSAQAADAIKSQINVKAPIQYTLLGEYNLPNAGIVKYYKLANGQRVAVLPKKGPTVLKSYFNVGSMNEPDSLRGVSHFDEHMAFNGTNTLHAGDFFKITNNMGALTNASTGFSMTDYFISSQLINPQDFELSVRIQADMLQNPGYKEEMIEKEKGPVTSEISMVSDAPENTAMNNCIKDLFQIQTTASDLVAGSISNIQNMTREQAYDYYNTWYTPDNCVTVVTGEVEPQKAIETIAKYFNTKRQGKPQNRVYPEFKPITNPVRKDFKLEKANNTTFSLGFCGPQNSDASESMKLELVLLALLGSKTARLSKALDSIQTGLTPAVERMGNRPQDPRAILFVGQSTPEKSEKMIKIIYQQINNLYKNPLTQEELETAKNLLRLYYSKLCENSHNLNSFIAGAIIDHDLNKAQNYLSTLEKITPSDLDAFVRKYFDLNKASLSVVHPSSVETSKILKFHKNASNQSSKAQQITSNKQTFDLSQIKQYRLKNNMEVTLNPNNSELSSSKIRLDAKVPANVKPAVPYLLSVILHEGTKNKNFTQLYTEANKRGTVIKFKANTHSISAETSSLSKDLGFTTDVVKEVLLNPRFNQNSLAYAKSFVKEILLSTPESADRLILKEIFPNVKEFSSKEEILKSLDETSLEDLEKFYGYIMNNAQAHATFSAPFKKQPSLINETIQKLSADFSEFKPLKIEHFKTYEPVQQEKIITKIQPKNQAEIVTAYKFKTNYNPKDHITISLLNTILGDGPYSRLFNDLRESQKLAYRVGSSVDYYGDTGILLLNIKTTTDNQAEGLTQYDNLTKSINGFKKHVDKMKKEKVTDEELKAAKLRLKTKIFNSIESSDGQTHVLSSAKDSYFSLASTQQSLKLIDEITAEDILKAANYIFNSQPLTSVLASKNTLENNEITANIKPL